MAKNNLLSPWQVKEIKTKVLLRDFEKINSVMSRREVKVRADMAAQTYQPPAWSRISHTGNGTTNVKHEVVFSARQRAFDVESVEGLIGITGLNYHELAHVLYTQGAANPEIPAGKHPAHIIRTKLMYSAASNKAQMIRAVFEDMRIERKFLSEYGPTKPYFQSVVGRFLLDTDDPKRMDSQFLLLAARDYVDPSIRAAYRERFAATSGEKVAKAYEVLANKFARLDMTTEADAVEGVRLILAAEKLLSEDDLKDAAEDSPFHGGTHTMSSTENTNEEGCEAPARRMAGNDRDETQEERDKKAEETLGSEGDADGESEGQGSGDGEDTDDADDESNGSGSGDSEDTDESDDGSASGNGSGEGEGDDDAEGSGDGEPTDGDADDDTDESGDGDGEGDEDGDEDSRSYGEAKASTDQGAGGGLSVGDVDGNSPSKPAEDIEEMIAEAEANESVLDEIAQKQRALRNLDRPGQSLTLGERSGGAYRTAVEPEMTLLAKRVSQEFRQLKVDLDPGRVPYKASGVVSMKRAMKGVDYDTVFDEWNAGQQDASDMEVVIMADLSGSMSSHAGKMSRALWVVRRAIQQASSSSVVSVLGYGTEAGYLGARGEQASANRYERYNCMDNGTMPYKSLNEAVALFATTQRKKRVLITLTDGVWGNEGVCNESIQKLNDAGVVTSLFMFNTSFQTDEIIRKHPLDQRMVLLGHHSRIYQESNDIADLIGFAKKVVTTAMKEN